MSKNGRIPEYGTHVINGHLYYRTRLKDADGRMRVLNAKTPEELYKKEQELRAEINEISFRKENPTVAEYCEKWLEIRSGTVSAGTLKGYRSTLNNYILKTLGEMYIVIQQITFNFFSTFSVKIKIPLAQRNLMYFPSHCLLPGVFVVSYLFVT